jgi:hypothetical protein
VDQEVGGSNPPSCTSKINKLVWLLRLRINSSNHIAITRIIWRQCYSDPSAYFLRPAPAPGGDGSCVWISGRPLAVPDAPRLLVRGGVGGAEAGARASARASRWGVEALDRAPRVAPPQKPKRVAGFWLGSAILQSRWEKLIARQLTH